jgi:two-component system, response regulator
MHDSLVGDLSATAPRPRRLGRENLGAISSYWLDLGLPKLSGLEVLRAIKTDTRTEKIAAVVLTGSQSELDFHSEMRLEANAFIEKPVNFAKLFDVATKLGLSFLLLGSKAPSISR